jgi:DNA polymerase III subunit alpha
MPPSRCGTFAGRPAELAKSREMQGENRSTSGTKISSFTKRQKDHVHYQPIGVRAHRRQKAAAKLHGGLKPMRFVSLHHHSTFSFLDGFQMPETHVRRATEIQMGALAMTEHGNIFSHVKLEKAAEKAGVKPIFGCEFYVGWTDKKRRTQAKNHITVIAKNMEGYANLLTLTTRSWKEGHHYEPTVDWRWLVEHQKGLVILSGCQGSALFTALVGGKHVKEEEAGYQRGLKVAQWMDARFDDFYVEVQAFPELEKARRGNPMLARIARSIGRPLVATMDCHYTAPEEAEVQQLLHSVRPGEQRTIEEMVRDWGYEVPLCPPPTDRAIYRRLRATGLEKDDAIQAIVSTEEIAQECDVTLPKLPRPTYPLPDGYETDVDLWRDWLREGWRYRECDRLPAKERDRYRAQLKKEMEVMEAKGYVNYFLIVADSIKFAKDAGIPVGPARGSAAASLACWLLRITEVNPMLFKHLVFERFIDWSREDMPDVDLDFATYGRPLVRDYLVRKYGAECVNNIGTFTMYKSKNALDDAARVHQIPKRDVEKLKELLIERSSGDLRASATIEDTVDQFDVAYDVVKENPELQYAMDLEGNARGFGVHAAGLVVSSQPITDVCAILEKEMPKGSGNFVQVVSMDKYDAERQGLEKLDYLALTTLDAIAVALDDIGMTLDQLYDVPLDDKEVMDGFQENDVTGIFQFDGRATRVVNGILKPDDFHEIANVNALSRPGPLHNGAVQGYVGAKFGTAQPERIHPALDAITEDTKYQIIYQEQILRTVVDIGQFDWTHAAYIRKIISKKLGDQEFNRQWSKFWEGAKTLHERSDYPKMTEDEAQRIWKLCITAGSYAFNAAHSVSYSILAVWCMWLKRHHPAAFFAAFLSKVGDDDKLEALRRDAVKHGVDVLPPNIESGATWRRFGGDEIRAGWEQVPGIGEKMAAKIEEGEPLQTWSDLEKVPGIGPKKREAIEEFAHSEDPFGIYRLSESLDAVRASLAAGLEGPGGKLPEPSHTAPEVMEASGGARVAFLGRATERNLRDLAETNRRKGQELDLSKVNHPELAQWVILTVRDEDDVITCIVARKKYPKFKKIVWEMNLNDDKELLLIKGKKGSSSDMGKWAMVFVEDMWVLEP